MTLLFHLAPRNIGGEGTRIDRRAQSIISQRHRAHVILMGMGDENRLDPVAPLRKPGDVGQDQVNTRAAVHVGKGHAHVDHDQPFLARLAIAIHIGVHAYFTRPAEGKVDQSFSAHAIMQRPC